MPLKLVPPRPGKTPYYSVRGTHLGIYVDRSTQVSDSRTADQIRRRWKGEIERGEYRDPRQPIEASAADTEPVQLTEAKPTNFADAALAYMQAGGERARLVPILKMTGECALALLPVDAIDQVAIDKAAAALFPGVTAQTKNREFYTPVAAVLHHVGVQRKIRRPKGWRGSKATSWLRPEQAFAAFAGADEVDAEFGLFLRTLLYGNGMRLSECLSALLRNLNLAEATLYLPKTKNSEARTVHLPPHLVAALANHPRGLDRHPDQRIFRFHASGRLREMLKETWRKAGLSFPRRQGGFHIFCHTYGTWMRRYAGLDNFDLTRTERWKDPRSAERYLHTDVNEEAMRADLLPVAPNTKSVEIPWTGPQPKAKSLRRNG